MAKKQRTRKQKMASNQRRHVDKPSMQSISPKQEIGLTPVVLNAHISKTNNSTISISDYRYLSKDLLKTAILTAAIIVIEIVIKQFTN